MPDDGQTEAPISSTADASLEIPSSRKPFKPSIYAIMSPKDKKKEPKKDVKEKKGLQTNATAKFAVLEAPGVTQPKAGLQGRRAKPGQGPSIAAGTKIGGTSFTKRTANPSWLQDRLQVYTEIRAARDAELTRKQPIPIVVTLPDGKQVTEINNQVLQAWRTTPYDVAVSISQGLADSVHVARVQYTTYAPDYDLMEDGMQGSDLMQDAMEGVELDATGILWDLTRPLVGSATVEFLKFDVASDAQTVFWHSSAHILGEALETQYGNKLTIGPPLAGGFYYDSYMGSDALKEEDCEWNEWCFFMWFSYTAFLSDKPIEAAVQKIVKEKQKFERLVITKEEGLRLFADNPFKQEILRTKVPDGTRTTVYKCGSLLDLCRGPHLPHTGKVKAFAVTRHSGTNWLGDTDNDPLQRMYGIAFPDKKMLKVWKENQEKVRANVCVWRARTNIQRISLTEIEWPKTISADSSELDKNCLSQPHESPFSHSTFAQAKERDHRRIAAKQELIMFHDLSPGSAFWLPHGARIYNKLIEFIKEHYWKRGYDEIITPNIYNLDLWHQSGHAMHYKDAMFSFEVEGQEWAMKPMNCPGHCLLFGSAIRSYRDLPLRFADFGVLHRNELSGALTGLTRVRRFQQDDAHIYCRTDQIESEVVGALEFMKDVYNTFGMTYKLELSTRPKKALGEAALWDKAEAALAKAMDEFIGPGNWRENPGDGAFYGPKIDIKVMDAMDRVHQCATIQLDFQLPIRFELQYTTESSEKGKQFERPVMIHRAMLGSVERMFAVLCEHFAGKWPLWLSPRQVMLIPVHAQFYEYCEKVRQQLHDKGFYADVDLSKNTFQKKVRNAQVAQYNFQLVVGQKEVESGAVNIRTRDNEVKGEQKVEEFIADLCRWRSEHSREV